jgi:hypothetical protein
MTEFYSASVDGIALVAATGKTICQLASTSAARIVIKEWWVEFDGVTATAVPVKVEVGRFTTVITTGTALTAAVQGRRDGGSPDPTGIVTHSVSTEGTSTVTQGPQALEIHRVPPTSGIYVMYPDGREWDLPVSSYWRIRCTAAAGVNATFGVVWAE